MAFQNDSGFRTFTANAAIEAFRVVELKAADTVGIPDAVADRVIGVTQHAVASGDLVTVKLIAAPGTHRVTVASSVAANAALYMTTTAGKVDDADPGSGVLWFVALEAGAGDLSVIEALAIKFG